MNTKFYVRYLRILILAYHDLSTYNSTQSPLSKINHIHVITKARAHPDAFETFLHRSGLSAEHVHKYEAIESVVATPDISKIFAQNAFGWNMTLIGEGMSHLTLWRHIASTQNEMHLVLTDDAAFVDGWVSKWNDEYVDDLPHDAFVSTF